MEKIEKMAFVTKIDEQTGRKEIEKVVIFLDGQEPLIEDYSREKHMVYIVDKLNEENRKDPGKNSMDYLKDIGFLEIASMENIEQMDMLKMEILEAQVRYGMDDLLKEQETTPIAQNVKEIEAKAEDEQALFVEMIDLQDYLNVCSLRENGQLDRYHRELLKVFLETSNHSIHAIEKAYDEFINASESDRETKRNQYIEVRDKALELVNDYERKMNYEVAKIPFKEKPTINETKTEDEIDYSKYSDGKLRTDFYDQPGIEFDKVAEQFAEGDKLLQDSLVAIWKSGIKTTACCRGHDSNDSAYIQFIKDDNCEKLVHATVDYMLLYGGLELDFNYYGKGYDDFIVTMYTEEDKKNYLNFVNSFLTKENEYTESTSNIPKYADCLLSFAKENNMNCRYCMDKDDMMFGFSEAGTSLLFSNSSPSLDENLDNVRDFIDITGKVPRNPFKCTEESLRDFIQIISPESMRISRDNQR